MSNVQLLIVDDEERFLTTTTQLMEKRGINTKKCFKWCRSIANYR
jgi:ActR/RegA family two-component response regulator